MYIVRTYAALMHLNSTDRINAVFTTIPFGSQYNYLGRIRWPNDKLLLKTNELTKYQRSVLYHYPPDTDPHNHKYTYMPIGASIHNARYIRDFEN